ncbi:MAG: PilZ domain-containing protein [Polyangiaceae bacterium]
MSAVRSDPPGQSTDRRSQADSDADRRATERHPVTWPVDCDTEETFLYAEITNISEMGIFVRTTEPLAIGTKLRLRFAPAHSPEIGSFELEGRVQWINLARPGCPNPGMGLAFFSLSLEDRERLVEVIRTIAYLPSHSLPVSD